MADEDMTGVSSCVSPGVPGMIICGPSLNNYSKSMKVRSNEIKGDELEEFLVQGKSKERCTIDRLLKQQSNGDALRDR